MKVVCIQMDIAFGQPEENIKKATLKLEEALHEQPDVIVLPELWTTGYDLTRLHEIADQNGEKTKEFLSSFAKKHHVAIVGGSVANDHGAGIANTMYIFNKEGEQVGTYDKLHLFKLMDEHLYLTPGKTENMFTLEDTSCAGMICYDIRFPEWIRVHTSKGAEVLFVVAEWPLPRLAHWKALLISRAIENQCYVVACNRSGSDPNNVFAGHSLIVDPWGDIVAEAGEQEEMINGVIDPQLVASVRKQIPIFSDRRTEFY
ncbi:carbon-nitrogen family hydrolase [Priestia koreensis]|uniref:carbon-nitrogen family hydrolase n=1 Tax=Priestia koreensis TaxID=284581 RepID=UPI00203A9BA1|nr:carbon-nitrogen family hydrolase [Priestia koreensis]MCM3003043.1 carbon-nitrogen family hydrolase [Priestia koreensis]